MTTPRGLERSNSPAAVWGEPGVEHHVFKFGAGRERPATLAVADPLGGALGTLGELRLSALFYVRMTESDVCRGGDPDPYTGDCP